MVLQNWSTETDSMIDNWCSLDWWIIKWTWLCKLIIHDHLSRDTQMLNQVGYAVHVKPDMGDFEEEQLERKSLCFAVRVYNKDNDVTLSSVTLSKWESPSTNWSLFKGRQFWNSFPRYSISEYRISTNLLWIAGECG